MLNNKKVNLSNDQGIGGMLRWAIDFNNAENSASNEINILFLGDVVLASKIGRNIENYGASHPFAKMPKGFFDADYTVFNLECCLSNNGQTWEPKPVFLRGDETYLDALPEITGKYIACIANNHILDYGEVSTLDTVRALKNRGFPIVGVEGDGIDEQPLVLKTEAGTIGIISFSPSAHPLPGNPSINVGATTSDEIQKQVAIAKNGVDLLIVTLHQGVEHSPYIDKTSRITAKSVIESGADCVVCHHAHAVQAIEIIGNKPLFHGIGNFIADLDFERFPHARFSIAIRVIIKEKAIKKIYIEPVILDDNCQPVPLDQKNFDYLGQQIIKLSDMLCSRGGCLISDFFAFKVWFSSQIYSVVEMGKSAGLLSTAAYYTKRVVAKLNL